MSLKLSKSLVKQGLALSVTALMMTAANAASSDKAEIQQLREEVAQLKSLIQQQQQVQQRQQVQLQEVQTQAAAPAPAQAPTLSGLLSKSGANVNIYGFVRGDVAYQVRGAGSMFNGISKVDLNGTASKANKDRLDATVNTTRLGLDFNTNVNDAKVGGKVEIDFWNSSAASTGTSSVSNGATRIRHAYLTYNNWLFGQTTSSYLSLENQPEMLDFGAPIMGTTRVPMVRYSDKINSQTAYFVGLEQGASGNRLPTLTGKIKYDFDDKKGSVSGRALVEEVRARDVGDDETAFGWGLAFGANYNVTDQISVYGDYAHTKGDNKIIGFSNAAYKADLNNSNDINLNEYDTVLAGITYKISPKLRSTLGYGAMFANSSDLKDSLITSGSKADTVQNKKLQQGWLNVMYSPVKPITFGAEYVYGQRETYAGAKGIDNRVELMAKYDF